MNKKQSTPEKQTGKTHTNGVAIVIAVIFYIAAFWALCGWAASGYQMDGSSPMASAWR